MSSYRESEAEKERTADLLRLLPKGRRSVLDLGARDGHFSRLLTGFFSKVTALDLTPPAFEHPNVEKVAGDATALPFPDQCFDCVFCAEVLEHITRLERACQEIVRVARHEIVIGVPYRQDIRCDRLTCRTCGRPNPPWGHVNTFDEARLTRLFPGLSVERKAFVGSTRERTNAVSRILMDWAGNPWGSYSQEEPCIFCGAKFIPPSPERPFWSKACSAAAHRLTLLQRAFVRPHGNWLHLVFSKDSAPAPG